LQLDNWCASDMGHPKAQAVLSYVNKGSVVSDLVNEHVLIARDGVLLTAWAGGDPEPPIFKQLTAKNEDGEKVKDQGDALIRWVVEAVPGQPGTDTWSDPSLHASWECYFSGQQTRRNICMVVGGSHEVAVASLHPARLRNPADKAKLISSNDTDGFTFRGRFHSAAEA